MNESTVCTINLDENFIGCCSMALSIAKMLYYDLSTDFSIKVYNSNILDPDELDALEQRFKNAKNDDDFSMTEEELLLLYTTHYVSNCFMQAKEAFYKWFLTFEKGEVDDSRDFCGTLQNVQMAAVCVIEDSGLCEEAIESLKKELLKIFGPCRDNEGNETIE